MRTRFCIKALFPTLTVIIPLVLVLFVLALPARSQNLSSRGFTRARTKFIEPPAPAPDWNTERRNHLTFRQLVEEFGLRLKGDYETQNVSDGITEQVKFGITWIDEDRIKIEFGTLLPGVRGITERALGKISFEFSKDPTVTEVAGEVPISSDARLIVSGKFDRTKNNVGSLGLEIKKLFLKFKGEVATDQPGRLAKTVEIKLLDIYSLTSDGLHGKNAQIAIEIDPEKFYNAFVRNAPRFVDFSKEPANQAVNAVAFQFDPLMILASASDNPSYFRVRTAIASLQRKLSDELPKGVKIQYSDMMLGELLQNGSANTLEQLGARLATSTDESQRAAIIEEFTRDARSKTVLERHSNSPTSITLVSMKSLVASAERFKARGNELPPNILKPGSITRIVGFMIDGEKGDVILLGKKGAIDAALSIDDLIVGFQTIFKFNATPFCSLDPDPVDPEGPQKVRVGGVSNDSAFALKMLEADYLMKKMAAGIVPVTEPGYVTMRDIMLVSIDSGGIPDLSSRFWFYPRSLQPGDIEISPDGGVVLFDSGVEVLTQRMVLSHDGIVSSDRIDSVADAWAAGFNRVLPALEAKHMELQRLHGLFDVILAAKTLQKLGIQPELVTRLSAISYERVGVPSSYASVRSAPIGRSGAESYYIAGGVNLSISAANGAFSIQNETSFTQLRRAASAISNVASEVSINGIDRQPASTGRSRSVDPAAVLALIKAGNTSAAESEIQKWIDASPFDAEPWRLLALSDLVRSRFDSAIANADRALALEGDDPKVFASSAIVRFQAYTLSGRNDEAMAAIDALVDRVPQNARSRLLRAEALAALERFAEARKEFREAVTLAPTSVSAYLSFGLFEISQGFSSRGRSYIDQARSLSRRPTMDPAINSSFALSEISLSLLGDAETRMANARRYADIVLSDKTADPSSRIRALSVQALLSLAKYDPAAAEQSVKQTLEIAPNHPAPLLMLVEWAIGENRPDLAAKYLAMAEKIAPNFPAVVRLRTLIK